MPLAERKDIKKLTFETARAKGKRGRENTREIQAAERSGDEVVQMYSNLVNFSFAIST